jgi:6-phosphogluconolactonase
MNRTTKMARAALVIFGLGAGLAGWTANAHAAAPGSAGAVYATTNSIAGNQVLVFDRSGSGALTPAGSFATGGTGTGVGLGSQGSLTASANGKWLFAVNAGSSSISTLQVGQSGLVLRDVEPSGGIEPISVTVSGNLVYVLNAGGTGNIAGFTVNAYGQLSPIAGSSQPLSSTTANPAQIQFSPNGRDLVVTEKGTNNIDTYLVNLQGVASLWSTVTSAASTPFGFDFDSAGHLFISDAGAGALSSYTAGADGSPALVTQVADFGNAPCWVAVSKNGKYVYTTNAHGGTISGYSIANDGSLTLLNTDGVTAAPGGTPLDMSFSANGQYLYLVNAGTNAIQGYSVGSDGSLTALSGTVTIPAGEAGIVAQ